MSPCPAGICLFPQGAMENRWQFAALGPQPAWQAEPAAHGHGRHHPLWDSAARPAGRRDAESERRSPSDADLATLWESRALTIVPMPSHDPVPNGAFMTTWCFRLAAAIPAMALVACGEAPKQAAAPPPPAVTVAQPVQRTVVDNDEYVGRFVAIDAVEVRARVSGYLDQVHFKDGEIVKQGDLLFTIDKRSFQNALAQAKATLTQARANLAFAEADLARGSELVRQKTITEQTFDQRTQAKRVAEASVSAQEAAVKQAELDLEFTELRAPVTGRIGDRRVSVGNLVTGGTGGTTTMLANIVSMDPIRFQFTFDEASYLRYERLGNTGQEVTSREGG